MRRNKEQSNDIPNTLKLLDQPICNTTIPMAKSTQRIFQRHQEALTKLKQYLQSTER